MAERLSLPFPVMSTKRPCLAHLHNERRDLSEETLILRASVIKTVFYPVPDPTSHSGDVLRWSRRTIAVVRS